jgi:hypothetical protein
MTNNYPSDIPPASGLTDDISLEDPQTGSSFETTTTGDTTGSAGGAEATDETGSTTGGDVKAEASRLAGQASEAGSHVAQVAKDETKRVASETGTQVKNLVQNAGQELRDQAATQQSRVAEGLRSVGSELNGMAENSESSGMARDLVQQVAQRANSAASWLDAREPGSLLEEVKSFARQRPGVFIAVAAGAGLLAGRLTRALVQPAESDTTSGTSQDSSTDLYTSPGVDRSASSDLPVYGSVGGDVIAADGEVPGVYPTGGL